MVSNVGPSGQTWSALQAASTEVLMPAIAAGALTLSATPWRNELALATVMARSADPGDPVTVYESPLLPAETTVITPASDALSEAIELGSDRRPDDEPSDMLITSR